MIEFEKINKAYRTGTNQYPVLKNISLVIRNGEYVLITGKSGSGKSTLLNILTGVDSASSGQVLVNGVDILRLNESQRTIWRGQNIGIIFQFFQLIPTLSVVENILLPMDLIDRVPVHQRLEKARELLSLVDLSEHEKKMPAALSGGEQQRAAIARALANDVDVIAADEPTGNLDSKNALMIFALLEKLNKAGKTIIMVTHEKDMIPGAGRKIVLSDGAILNDCSLKAGAAQ